MNTSKLLVVALLCLLGAQPAMAQPATASLQLIPPHSPFLADFTEPTSQSLLFNLQMFDQPTLDVRLHMTISGAGITLTTNGNWVPPMITLTNGIPSVFTGYDLQEYFDPYHLDFTGMTREEFINGGGILPEGFYEVCIQAMNFPPGQNTAASNNACANAFFEYYDPPKLMQPIGEQLAVNPQTLLFNWVPMHPTGNFITEYDLQIWTKVPGMAIQQIIDFTNPLYQTTTVNLNTFPYGMIQPDLTEGHEYLTRVRARAQNGSAVFNNDGYSEIEQWSWGAPECFPPKNAQIALEGTDGIKVTWMMPLGNPVATYEIRYRSIKDGPDEWTEVTANGADREYIITGLEHADDDGYEVEIKSICTPGESDWLNLGVLVMGDGSSYVCGLETTVSNLDSTQLLSTLLPEDMVYAGDFSVVVTNANGQNGKFWGNGYVYVPFLKSARVNVEFNGITVNNGYRMVKGFMTVTGAGISLISGEMADIITNVLETLETIDDLLAAAEQIIGVIDDLIAEIEPYLPDGVIQNLLDAQQQLIDAQQMVENGDTGAEQALADAQTALNNANQEYTEALAEFIEDFIDVLRETFIQIHDEQIVIVDSLEGSFNTAHSEYSTYIDAAYMELSEGATATGDPIAVIEIETQSTTEDIDSLATANPELSEYITKSRDYLVNARAYRTAEVLSNLKTELVVQGDIDAFVRVMKAEDLNLLREIGTKLKEEVEEQLIVDHVKDKIITTMENVLVKVADVPPE